MHFPRRAYLFGEGFEHRERWIEDRLLTVPACFAASGCGFAVMDNRLHVLVRLEPDAANGWSAEDVRPAVVGDRRIKASTDRGS
jgi:hypothetical protein